MQDGFHFIELLITLAIITILAALSLPVYTQHLMHARRLEAAQTLARLAVKMEEYYIAHNTYRHATLAALHFPEQIANGNYQLAISSAKDNDYVLAAKPLHQQAKRDRSCAMLSINANGTKKIAGVGTVESCW